MLHVLHPSSECNCLFCFCKIEGQWGGVSLFSSFFCLSHCYVCMYVFVCLCVIVHAYILALLCVSDCKSHDVMNFWSSGIGIRFGNVCVYGMHVVLGQP